MLDRVFEFIYEWWESLTAAGVAVAAWVAWTQREHIKPLVLPFWRWLNARAENRKLVLQLADATQLSNKLSSELALALQRIAQLESETAALKKLLDPPPRLPERQEWLLVVTALRSLVQAYTLAQEGGVHAEESKYHFDALISLGLLVRNPQERGFAPTASLTQAGRAYLLRNRLMPEGKPNHGRK